MNTKDTLKQIKVLLGMEKPEEKVTFAEAKLKDGTNVSYDKLEVGSNFLVKTDAETSVPAPAGEYELEDGTIVVVGSDNLITEVKMPEESADENTNPEAKPEETPEEKPEEKPEETPEADYEKRIASLEEQVAKLTEALNMLVGEFSEVKSEFASQERKIEEIASAPATEPVHFKREKKVEGETTFERRLRLIDELKK